MEFQYRGLTAKLSRHIVTQEQVQQQLQRMAQQHPLIEEVTDRAAQNGDELVLDYAGFCDGEQFAGGTAENQTLTLGSGTFIPGFEEQLVGAQAGQQVTVDVTFPEQYHSQALAGKKAQFCCTVHQIRVKSPRQIDDAFAKEVYGISTAQELTAQLQKSMQAQSDNAAEMELQDELLRQAAQTLTVKISDEELKEAVREQLQTMQAQLAQQGLSLEMYLQFTGTTQQQLEEQMIPDAQQSIRMQRAVDRIVLLEGLGADPAEMERAYDAICQSNGLTRQQLTQFQTPELEKAVRRSILTGKVMELLRQYAKIEKV